MNDTQINSRQQKILVFLSTNPNSTRSQIEESLNEEEVSKITIIRDLNHLIEFGWVQQEGGGKYVTYNLIEGRELLIPVNLDKYFDIKSDDRTIKHQQLNMSIFNNFINIFTNEEMKLFEDGKKKLVDKFSSLDESLLKRELERFTIELSWKSSQIEGNTYSLLETEELIKNKKEAKGHDKSEATMILNHKEAFDTVLENKNSYKKISISNIRTIHSKLVKSLGISTGVREAGVGITGTKYMPIDNRWQLDEVLNKTITHINKSKSIPEKALILLAMISYIQPFNDGNKRTSRMVSNSMLLANDYYPLSYRSVDEVEYKKALILFYEQNNIYHLKRLFVEQQKFAIENYFV